jgi:hypothetical protein
MSVIKAKRAAGFVVLEIPNCRAEKRKSKAVRNTQARRKPRARKSSTSGGDLAATVVRPGGRAREDLTPVALGSLIVCPEGILGQHRDPMERADADPAMLIAGGSSSS